MRTFHFPAGTLLLLMTLFWLASCRENFEASQPPVAASGVDSAGVFQIEQAYPGLTGIAKQGHFLGQPIAYQEINGQAVFQGDMILSPEQLSSDEDTTSDASGRKSGAGRSNKLRRWRNFTIPYTIDPALPNQARVTQAIAHWEANTPLRFVLRSSQTDYLTFKPGTGCSSYVGRKGGQQFIELAAGCTTGATIHEIGHAAGLLHEHSRTDRNNYIEVKWGNIQTQHQDQFEKYKDQGVLGFDFGTFDFNSIMLYPSFNTFAINSSKPTLTRKDGSTFGQRTRLSSGDRRTVISMYSNVYIVWRGKLYAVSVADGDYTSLGGGWSGASKTIAEDNEFIWATQNGILWRANRFNGEYKAFGKGWEGTVGVAGTDDNGNLYAVQGGRLWRIDRQGQRTRLSNEGDDWAGTQAVFYHNGFLYIVWKNTLFKVSPQTGLWIKKFDGFWNSVKGIGAARGNGDLFIVEGSALKRVNTTTGVSTLVKPAGSFPNTAGIVGVAGNLYIVSEGTLWRVEENGNKFSLGGGWEGTESMGVMRNPHLF